MEKLTCCCCIPLRAGVITLGIVGVIASIIEICEGIFDFVNNEPGSNVVIRTLANDKPHPELINIEKEFGQYYMVMSVLNVITDAALLIGVFLRKLSYMKLCVKANYACIGFSAAIEFLISILIMKNVPEVGVKIGLIYLLFQTVIVGIVVYWIQVVKRFIESVKEEWSHERIPDEV